MNPWGRWRWLALGGLGALLAIPLALGQDRSRNLGVLDIQQQAVTKRSQFMRQKLEFSKNVLEGLAREDYPLIEKNAKALKELSKAAEWEAPILPNVEQYAPLTREFQRLADELMKKAKSKNIDGATLAYVQLTVNCVNCHKYVREAAPAKRP